MAEGRDKDGKFAAGNLFSVGNNGGRPPKYDDPAEMEKKIAEYLEWEDQWKKPTAKGEGKGIYTLEGCALFLGFATLKSMYDYEKRSPEFLYTLNRFRMFLTHWNVQKLYWGGTFTGSQFWLKNKADYSDESTLNQNTVVREIKIEEVKVDTPLADDE